MSKLKKEISRFLIAGVSAVGTDLISYYIMINFLNNDMAKTFSFLLGSMVAYTINKYFTVIYQIFISANKYLKNLI